MERENGRGPEIIGEIIRNIDAEKKQTRIPYLPYDMDTALSVWQRIGTGLAGQQYEINDLNKKVIQELIRYIHADSCTYDIDKGIALIGSTGTGKTLIMKIMQSYMKIDNVRYYRDGKPSMFNFKMVSSRQIAADYSENGYDGLYKHCYYTNICIDDLGTEPELSMNYGNRENVIQLIIEERYSRGLMTHLTANYSPEEILQRYGDRVYSRMKHSMNFIELINKDFRL